MHNKKSGIELFNLFSFITIFLICSYNSYPQNAITELNKDGLLKLVKNESGKTLLINVWATWCVPCREEFPDLIKLKEKYKDSIDVVGISLDYPDEVKSKIKPFAKKMKVNFPLYVNTIRDSEIFINIFDEEWNGAIPATFIYDGTGTQLYKIYGKKSFEFFDEIISKINAR